MLNEGIVRPDTKQLMKTEMIRELHELGGSTPLRSTPPSMPPPSNTR